MRGMGRGSGRGYPGGGRGPGGMRGGNAGAGGAPRLTGTVLTLCLQLNHAIRIFSRYIIAITTRTIKRIRMTMSAQLGPDGLSLGKQQSFPSLHTAVEDLSSSSPQLLLQAPEEGQVEGSTLGEQATEQHSSELTLSIRVPRHSSFSLQENPLTSMQES